MYRRSNFYNFNLFNFNHHLNIENLAQNEDFKEDAFYCPRPSPPEFRLHIFPFAFAAIPSKKNIFPTKHIT